MQELKLNQIILELLNSLGFQDTYYVDRKLATNLLSIKGQKARLQKALAALVGRSKEAKYSGGFFSVCTENVNLSAPVDEGSGVKQGMYICVTICCVEMANPNPFKMKRLADSSVSVEPDVIMLKDVMTEHNGFMTVESLSQQSTAFKLYFPAAQEEYGTNARLRGGDEKVLVVDDESMQRAVYQRVLARLGYNVSLCAGGEEAIAFVKRLPQDLLVLDMVMQGMSGTETYREILRSSPAQKAIILSGYALANLVEEAIQLGVGAFLSKPVSPHELAVAIRTELDKPSLP